VTEYSLSLSTSSTKTASNCTVTVTNSCHSSTNVTGTKTHLPTW